MLNHDEVPGAMRFLSPRGGSAGKTRRAPTVTPNNIERPALEVETTDLEASRPQLAASFRNSIVPGTDRLFERLAAIMDEVTARRERIAEQLDDARLARLHAVEQAAARLEFKKQKSPYQHVLSGGLPGLGKR